MNPPGGIIDSSFASFNCQIRSDALLSQLKYIVINIVIFRLLLDYYRCIHIFS